MRRPLAIAIAVALITVMMIGIVVIASSVVDRFSQQYAFRKAGKFVSKGESQPAEISDLDAMIRLPGGTFRMGAPADERTLPANLDEAPPHEVRVAPFEIGKYEVTNLQYEKFVLATGYRAPLRWEEGKYPEGKEYHPVLYVNYEDAEAYAKWAGGRLCREAEWEFAAKGTDGRQWPWGDRWDDGKANVYYTVGDTTPVNAYPQGASPYGVLGMADNVWEWVDDKYERYPGNTLSDWYYQQGYYLLRSGSWKSDFLSSRTTTRNPTNPIYRADYFGIRICKDVSPDQQVKKGSYSK